MSEALLPCPFCGAGVFIYQKIDSIPDKLAQFVIECKLCFAEMRSYRFNHFLEKEEHKQMYKRDLIKMWNRRTDKEQE